MKKKYKFLCYIKENLEVETKDILCRHYENEYCKDKKSLCPHQRINLFDL